MSHLVIPITITMIVEDIATVLANFDQVQVHRSTDGATGTYVEITTAKTRVVLVAGQTSYTFEDQEGSDEYWYKFRYYNSATLAVGTFSTAERGANDPALDVLSIVELKTNYLFGLDLTKDDGVAFPDSMFAFFIRQAVSWLEHRLDIKIRRVQYTEERHDYFKDDYKEWMFIKLHHCPVISVESVKMVLPGEVEVHDFDNDWIHIQRESGQLQLVPGIGSMGNIMLGATGFWIPMYRRMSDFVPDVFRVAYTAGFGVKRGDGVSPAAPDFDAVPDMIKELVGKVASFGPLNIAGDLLGGAGIASQSISIDGLSQSFNTTSSATNAGYGSRLLQFSREIKLVLPELRRYYRGISLAVV